MICEAPPEMEMLEVVTFIYPFLLKPVSSMQSATRIYFFNTASLDFMCSSKFFFKHWWFFSSPQQLRIRQRTENQLQMRFGLFLIRRNARTAGTSFLYVSNLHCIANALCCQCIVLPVHYIANSLYCQFTVLQIHCIANSLYCQCTVLPMHCIANALYCQCTVLPMHCIANVLSLLNICTFLPVFNPLAPPVYARPLFA